MQPVTQNPVVCFGEVLWDILPSGPLPGGAPMNVAYHLQKLGINTALITKIGNDNYGKDLKAIVSNNGVATTFIAIDDNHQTGLVYANTNDSNEVEYDIVFPSAWDFIEWQEEFKNLVNSARYFVYGSLTSRHLISRQTLNQLLDIANTKVLDINLRPPHFNRKSIEHLLTKADMLKMNIAELNVVTNWFGNVETTEEKIKLMQDKFDIETVIVTMGADGALVNNGGTLHRHPGFTVQVADTIGSGDSFLAGFLYKLLSGSSLENALEFASGIGAFIATQNGACPSYQLSQITSFIDERSIIKH